MAWRPYENLISGELDNTLPGKITGWIQFYRNNLPPLLAEFNLKGDFHEDIRGCVIRLKNKKPQDRNGNLGRSGSYMKGFSELQEGEAGDITAGLPVNGECPYTNCPYIEWFSEKNGRVVLELERSQVEIIRRSKIKPLSAKEQAKTELKKKQAMIEHLKKIAEQIDAKTGFGFAVGIGTNSHDTPDKNNADESGKTKHDEQDHEP